MEQVSGKADQALIPNRMPGVFTTPLLPDGFDPNSATREAWSAEDRIEPEFEPQIGVTHLRRKVPPPEDTNLIQNAWSGGSIQGTWTGVVGRWIVPTVTVPREPQGSEGGWNSSSWTGLDGGVNVDDDVLQAGVQQKVNSSGNASYVAWFEWFGPNVPGAPPYIFQTNIPNFAVHPGDTVFCSVQYAGAIAPPAALVSPIDGYATPWNSQQHVNYIGQDGHVHELVFHDTGGWGHTDLSQSASSTGGLTNLPPKGAIDGYATPWNSQQHVNYIGQDGHVHELVFRDTGGWTHTDLSQSASSTGGLTNLPPKGAIDGYATPWNSQQHVNYIGQDGHVHELVFRDTGGWTHTDLSQSAQGTGGLTNLPPKGAIDGYATPWNSQQHVNYIGQDGHVHELVFRDTGGWTHTDLSQSAQGTGGLTELPPKGAIDGYATPWNSQQHVNYIGQDGHVHELVFRDTGGWGHTDLSQSAQGTGGLANLAPKSGSAIDGYATPWNSQQHVNYIGQDGHVHELVFRDTGGWGHTDLSQSAQGTGGPTNLPLAVSAIDGYATPWNSQQHVDYIGQDGHVHELYFSDSGGWVHNDLSEFAGRTGVISFANETTHKFFSITLTPPPGASFAGNTAEWIMEAPDTGEPVSSLPRFSQVQFTSATCTGPNSTIGDPANGNTWNITGFGRILTSVTLGHDTVTINYIGL